jgi:hypothetical protein
LVPTVGDELTPAPAAPDARFARFWAVYPNKTGKAAALKAWQKHKPSETLTDMIINAVERQKHWPTWTRDNGRFIPNPATWLNQGRWDDQPVEIETSIFSSHSPKTSGNEAALQQFAGMGHKR